MLLPNGRLAASLECLQYVPTEHAATCKVFHHVWAPDGRLLTKGLGGLYPHHRGLFLGWNRLRCRGQTFDFWHCSHGETQRLVAFVAPTALGLGDDWQVAAIDWLAGDGKPVLHEHRALRACPRAFGSTVLDVRIELRAADATVLLDGDPQHAGHQFRAVQQFAEPHATPVRYLRPAMATAQADDVWTACDWIAAVMPLADGPVTVLRIEGRGNPEPATWSTRGYGRFGAMCRYELVPDVCLRLAYTYIVATGERDPAWCAACAAEAAADDQSL